MSLKQRRRWRIMICKLFFQLPDSFSMASNTTLRKNYFCQIQPNRTTVRSLEKSLILRTLPQIHTPIQGCPTCCFYYLKPLYSVQDRYGHHICMKVLGYNVSIVQPATRNPWHLQILKNSGMGYGIPKLANVICGKYIVCWRVFFLGPIHCNQPPFPHGSCGKLSPRSLRSLQPTRWPKHFEK